FWVFKTVRLFGGPMEAMTAAVMVAVSSFAIRYATETKHYVFEAAAGAAVCYTAALLSKALKSSARLWAFLATALAGYAFSFTLLVVVIACWVGVVSVALLKGLAARRETQTSRSAVSKLMLIMWGNRALFLVCLAACMAGLCVYVFYSVPVTV